MNIENRLCIFDYTLNIPRFAKQIIICLRMALGKAARKSLRKAPAQSAGAAPPSPLGMVEHLGAYHHPGITTRG